MCPALEQCRGPCNVPEDLLKAPRAARDFAGQLLQKHAPKNFDDALKILRAQWESLLSLDRGMIIEQTLFECAQESLDSSFHLKRTPERFERTRKRCRKRFQKAGSGDASPSENSHEELASESALELQHS